MGSSSKTVPQATTTAQSSEPWAAAQPALSTALSGAHGLYTEDIGFKPYGGQTQADMSTLTKMGLDQTQNIAQGQGGLLGQDAYNYSRGLINNQGITDSMRPALGTLEATARGDNLGTVNPYLQQMLDANSEKVRNQVNSSMSGAGRYGSGMHTQKLGQSLTDATAPLLFQNYDNERQRQLSAAQGLTDIYGTGANRALQTAGMGSELTGLLYDPADRLSSIGSVYDQRAQNQINADIELYNAQQARPWEQLGRLNAIATGAGQMGGTQTGSSTKPVAKQSGLQRALGYGSAGLGLLGSIF
jgi:hypothetical protein